MTLRYDIEFRARWLDEMDEYGHYCDVLLREVKGVLSDSGVTPERITARLKDPDHLAKKVVLKGYQSYSQITDKAGIRVVVRLDRHVDEVVQLLADHFGGAIEDKREALGIDTFRYRATHVQVPGLADGSESDKECEIQVRTVCADAWSVMSQFLVYKAPTDLPEEIRRGQAALAAMFELADAEYDRQYEAILNHPDLRAASLVEEIASSYVQVSGASYDPATSAEVIDVILPTYGEASAGEIAALIALHVERNAVALTAVYEKNRENENRSVFLFQPESLMVAERLDAHLGAQLRNSWTSKLPIEELERLVRNLERTLD